MSDTIDGIAMSTHSGNVIRLDAVRAGALDATVGFVAGGNSRQRYLELSN